MKEIGFIDYYLNEWHADNYPKMIKKASSEYEVCYAYAHSESPVPGRMSNREWSEKYGIPLVATVEELIGKSDCIVVLSPDNPEMHEELTDLALKSGKPVYVDKTFAPDVETAKRIFLNASSHNTPVYSSSALNFAEELAQFNKNGIKSVKTVWGGEYSTHMIHQIEPVCRLVESDPVRVKFSNIDAPCLYVEFKNGVCAKMTNAESAYNFTVEYADGKCDSKIIESPFFEKFIKAMLEFFDTKIIPVPQLQTLRVISLIEASRNAEKNPGEWIEVRM